MLEKPDGTEELAATAASLLPTLRERARATEQLRRVPDDTMRELKASGLLRVLQPARYGGYEADPLTYFEIASMLSAADASAGWVYGVMVIHTWALAQRSPQLMDEVWGDDPDTLMVSSPLCKQGGIDKVEGGYRVTGRYGFASGCHHASWALIAGLVRNSPEDGYISLAVPKADFEIVDNWHVMGLCGTGSCDLAVDAFVPTYRAATPITPRVDINVAPSPVYRLPYQSMFSASVTVPLLGAAQGALDEYLSTQRERVRLFRGSVAAEPATQARVAESAADLDAARLCLYQSFADMLGIASQGAPLPVDLVARANRDQVLAVQRAVAAVDRVFANAGGRAISLDNPLQRAWRDIHAGAAHAANHPDNKLAAYGARAFGLEPAALF